MVKLTAGRSGLSGLSLALASLGAIFSTLILFASFNHSKTLRGLHFFETENRDPTPHFPQTTPAPAPAPASASPAAPAPSSSTEVVPGPVVVSSVTPSAVTSYETSLVTESVAEVPITSTQVFFTESTIIGQPSIVPGSIASPSPSPAKRSLQARDVGSLGNQLFAGTHNYCTGHKDGKSQRYDGCSRHKRFQYFDPAEIYDQKAPGTKYFPEGLRKTLKGYRRPQKAMWMCYLLGFITFWLTVLCGLLGLCSSLGSLLAAFFAFLTFLLLLIATSIFMSVFTLMRSQLKNNYATTGLVGSLSKRMMGYSWVATILPLIAGLLWLGSSYNGKRKQSRDASSEWGSPRNRESKVSDMNYNTRPTEPRNYQWDRPTSYAPQQPVNTYSQQQPATSYNQQPAATYTHQQPTTTYNHQPAATYTRPAYT